MARIANIAVKQQTAHYMLAVRKTIRFMEEYSQFAEQTLALTSGYLNEMGIYPLSGPMVCFHNQSLEALDVEMGWQVAQKVEPSGSMHCSEVPARKVVTSMDLGPYELQDPTLMELLEWANTNGYEPQGPICYCYLNETNRPAAEYLTQMILPIK